MFIAIDAGNTNIVFSVMDRERIIFASRLRTDRHKTGDEYAVFFRELLHIHNISTGEVDGGIISSVVPSLKKELYDAVCSVTGKKSKIVGPGLKNGLKIRIDNPAQLGSDRVAEAVAAIHEYPLPAVIFDMGTANTFSVVGRDGSYLGGMILPGTLISLDALTDLTSQLPQIDLAEPPANLIGTNTIECMKSGIIYGTAAMVDGVIDRIAEDLGEKPEAIATGSLSDRIIPHCRQKIVLDRNLLLKGLRIIYLKNQR
ncbi:MAG: type III pantothenate kinase [Bilifractor sp.]